MQHIGKLQSWNDERGYGFIAPTHGGAALFVHISAFTADGSRPTVGEQLAYETGTGPNGRPQAVRAWRQALHKPGERRLATATRAPSQVQAAPGTGRRSRLPALLVAAIVLGLGGYGYRSFDEARTRAAPDPPNARTQAQQPADTPAWTPAAATRSSFQCDGRTHCSQMTSCDEATYFLKHCPGTTMDGDRDGVPCEQQWCGPLR